MRSKVMWFGLLLCMVSVAGLHHGQRQSGWLATAASLLITPALAEQQASPWIDPMLALREALAKAEADEGRQSGAYVTALQSLVQAHLGRGEYQEALELFRGLLAMVESSVPADDPRLTQARATAAQFQELALACGAPVSDSQTAASGDEEFRLVPQSASFFGDANAVSSDGRWLVSAATGALVVRDAESGLVVRQIRDAPGEASSLLFIPGSQHLAASFNNGCLVVWDAVSGMRSAVAAAPIGMRLNDLAVSPDGKMLAASYTGNPNGEPQKRLSVWHLESGALQRRFFLDEKLPGPIQPTQDIPPKIIFTANGQGLFSYSFLVTRYWNLAQGRLGGWWWSSDLMKQAGAAENEMLQEIAISPNGKYMVFRSGEAVWLRQTGHSSSPALRLEKPESYSNSPQVKFSPDGGRLLIGTEALYEVASGEKLPLEDIPGISWGDWAGPGRLLLSYVSGGDYYLLGEDLQPQYRASGGADSAPSTVAFANGGSLLVTDAAGEGYWDLGSLYRHDQKPAEVRFDQPVRGGLLRYVVRAYWHMSSMGPEEDRPSDGVYSDSSNRLYTAHKDGRVRVWPLSDEKSSRDLAVQAGAISAIGVSRDERYLASASGGKSPIDFSGQEVPPATLSVHELETGSLVWSDHGHAGSIVELAITPDGRYLVAMSGARITVHDLASGELLRAIDAAPDDGQFAAVAVDAKGQLAYASRRDWLGRGPRVVVLDVATGEEIRSFRNDTAIGYLALSPDGRLLAAAQNDKVARLWNLENGNAVSLAENYIRLPDEERTLENMFSPPSEWVAYTPDGYFAAGRGGTGLVAVVRGTESYNLDQFGLRFNRPDILLERLQLGQSGVVEYFRHRYQARVRTAGLKALGEERAVAIPVARIIDAGQPDAAGRVQLKLAFSSQDVDLLSYNVYINGAPLFSAGGQAVSGRSVETELRVPLSAGNNRIEVSVLAANGMESPRKQLDVTGPEATRKPDLYFLGFGVSQYADPRLNLGYAHKDVQDLADMFAASQQFGQVHVHAYTNDKVTPEAIREAKALLANARVDDVAVVLVAGHGMHARDAEGVYYYLTHDADLERLAETTVPFSALESLLVDIPARNRLLLLDTCESGEKEPAFVTGVFASLQGTQVRARTSRGLTLDEPEEQAAAPQHRDYLQQRSRYIFNDLSRRNGVVMFASSAGHELSYESAEKQNGYFTEALLQVLGEPGRKSLETLRKKVRDLVIKYSDGRQHPGVYWNNLHAHLQFEPIQHAP